MSWTVYVMLSVLSLSPGSVTIANDQVQTADAIRALKGGDLGQCPSVEERGRVRNELSQFVASEIANTTSASTMSSMNGT